MTNIKNQISNILDNISEDEIFTHSAALAFYTALGIAPLVVLMIVTFALLGFDLQSSLIKEVGASIGPDAAALLNTIISAANDRPDIRSFSGLVATAGLVISASIIFVQLQSSLNIIFDAIPPKKDHVTQWQMFSEFIKERLFSMGLLLGLIAIFTVSLLVSTAIPFLSSAQTNFWLTSLNFVVSFAIFSGLFGLIFKWMPDRKIDFRNAMMGGALTSLLFMIGKTLIGFYLAKSAIGSPYGAAGSLMVTLVWVYYSSLVVFVGAEATYTSLVKAGHA